jgi:hypothetical protein
MAESSAFSIDRLLPAANDLHMSNPASPRSVFIDPTFLLCFWIFCIGFVSPSTVQAAESGPEKPKASLVLLNALPGPENLHVFMANQDVMPAGLTPGQSTGGVIIPGGKPAMEARCPGFASTKFVPDFPNRANCAIIFYPGDEVNEGPDKGKRKIGVFFPPPILDGQAPKSENWGAFMAGPLAEASFTLNGKTIRLSLAQPLKLEVQGFLEIKSNGATLYADNPDIPGNYWLIFLGSSPDKLSVVKLNHIHYDIP